MKKLVLILLAVVLGGALVFSGCPKAATPEVFELRMATVGAEMMKDISNVNYFCDYVEENSDGRITIKKHFGGSLAGMFEVLDLVKTGGADIVGLSPYNLYQDAMPLVGGLQFMYLNDYADVLSFMNGIVLDDPETAPLCEEELVEQNIEWMTYGSTGEMVICVNFLPAANLDDLQGRKIASLSDLPYFDAVGMSTVMSSVDEAYESLGRQVYEGFVYSTSMMADLKLHEVSTAAVRTGAGGCSDGIVMNRDTWNSLPADLQQVCRDAADFTEANSIIIYNEGELRAIQVFEDYGCEVNMLPPADQELIYSYMLEEWKNSFMALCDRTGVPAESRDLIIGRVYDFALSP